MTPVGQVNSVPKLGDQVTVSELAVGSPLAVIVPGFTAPTVVEEVSWQHKSLVLVTLVRSAKGGVKLFV